MKSRSKQQIIKQLEREAEKVRRKVLPELLQGYYDDPKTTPEQRRNADILKAHRNKLFSDEEIIDIVWGKTKLLHLLPATLWFRPRDILDQTDALIYLVKIVTGKRCDGSERITLSDLQFNLVVVSLAEGIYSENVSSKGVRTRESCLRYAKQQVRNLLKKSPRLNGGDKYVPENLGSRTGQKRKKSV